jgi:hypothetical protein
MTKHTEITHRYPGGRALTKTIVGFVSESDKAAFLSSMEWTSLLYGYGAHILSETPTTLIYSASTSAD